ncbi:glycosyltransferase family 2 protein [Azohydromonas lata]|uniref:Glycosyltransferase family 2 protein n=1 Tax=Azohydromonas lata TaxID=45677 RepID=A0ABU5IMF8_9BURK|nr:glycosyltransferase family 2 protein [Azohydromonas lata]MDZ5460073.1 glycosyltransferase family 2 protein [Azohydromonas lata]
MRDLTVTALAMVATVLAFLLGADHVVASAWAPGGAPAWQAATALLLFAGLSYGSLVYLLARFGHGCRQQGFTSLGRPELDSVYDEHAGPAPRVCVLVPSYKEELRVVRQTLLSAALSEYPAKRIVLLLDDPRGGPGADADALQATRELVAALHARFEQAAQRLERELAGFMFRTAGARAFDAAAEAQRAAGLYEALAAWVEQLAEPQADAAFAHVDDFFNRHIVQAAAHAHRERAAQLRAGRAPTRRELRLEFQRLATLLRMDISAFERKRFDNLSHAPNKAMNLNSYIGLLGRAFRVERTPQDEQLREVPAGAPADFSVPAADYLLTLDADSLVRPDYLLKLTAVMARDERIAVAQTPYSSHPGAPGLLERCAGAQTDIQYLVHQGFTFFGATYWVGANALLRVAALQDIRETVVERGFEVPVFIQDKTVIEDTGSTLDLVRRGWTLHNHPERLAYSATPPDFGALIIQRRRWANGGLIILADLLRYVARPAHGARPGLCELLIRAHYLLSPTLSSLGVALLALLPLDPALASPWLALSALPYLLLYAQDLRRCGYGWRDFVRVYALNLMLVPVNAAGVLQSLRQMLLRRKAAFARTPKVGDRTASPAGHVAAQLSLPALALAGALLAAHHGQWLLSGFAAFNALCLAYGLARFIGVGAACADLKLGAAAWLSRARRGLRQRLQPRRTA